MKKIKKLKDREVIIPGLPDYDLTPSRQELMDKINELIDYINKNDR